MSTHPGKQFDQHVAILMLVALILLLPISTTLLFFFGVSLYTNTLHIVASIMMFLAWITMGRALGDVVHRDAKAITKLRHSRYFLGLALLIGTVVDFLIGAIQFPETILESLGFFVFSPPFIPLVMLITLHYASEWVVNHLMWERPSS